MNAAIHWSGPILAGGGLVLGVAIVMFSLRPTDPPSPVVASLLLVSSAGLLVALPFMYAAQADATGGLGLAGHVLLSTGVLLPVVVAATPLMHPSADGATGESVVTFVLGIALTLGLLFTAVATFQAGVFPRPAAALLLVATGGFAFVFFVAEFLPAVAGRIGNAAFGIVLAAGLVWIGATLWERS